MSFRDVLADFMHASRVHFLLANSENTAVFRAAAGLLIDARWGYDEKKQCVIPARILVLEVECKLEGAFDPAFVRKRLGKIEDAGLIRLLPVWPRKLCLTPQGVDVAREEGFFSHAARIKFNPHYRRGRTRGEEPNFVMR